MVIEHTNQEDQECRIRAALGLSRGPLPEVQSQCLRRYYEYLAANLSLPFDAESIEEIAGFRRVPSAITVVALVDPDGHATYEECGLLCRARRGTQEIEVPLVDVELGEGAPNYRLIEDYWYWFWNWRFDPKI